jgi:hypothetical protein
VIPAAPQDLVMAAMVVMLVNCGNDYDANG